MLMYNVFIVLTVESCISVIRKIWAPFLFVLDNYVLKLLVFPMYGLDKEASFRKRTLKKSAGAVTSASEDAK